MESQMGFRNYGSFIPVLFFLNYGFILSNSRKEIAQLISLNGNLSRVWIEYKYIKESMYDHK